MNEREKIIEIIAPFISAYGEDEAIADALIAAGIGDVTAHETETEYWKTIGKIESDEHHTAIKNAVEHARHLMQERDEYKYRVEVAERALFNMTKEYILAKHKIATTKDGQFLVGERMIALFAGDAIKQAEKEFAEDEE